MKIAMIPEKGCLEYARAELRQRFGLEPAFADETFLEADASEETIIRIMYFGQSLKRVLLLVGRGKAGSLEDLEECISGNLEGLDLKKIIGGNSISVECQRAGEHDYNSVDAESVARNLLKEKTGCAVDLRTPGLVFFLYIEDEKYVFGLDLAGRDLSKRQYKVFTNPVELKGTIAFSFLMFSGYKPGMVFADPFALSGTIPLEAALYESGVPVNYYSKQFDASKTSLFRKESFERVYKEADSAIRKPGKPLILSMDPLFRNVSAQKKNAKIAGVEKFVAFSRTDTDWLDIKMKEQKASLICTKPLEPSRTVPERKAEESYKALFLRAKQVLGEKGFLCVVTVRPEFMLEQARNAGYKEVETRVVWQGKQELFFTRLETNE